MATSSYKQITRHLLASGLILSLILHTLSFGGLIYLANHATHEGTPKELITFQPLQTPDGIKLDLHNKETLNEIVKDAKFLAEHRARVKEESKARFVTGETANRKFPSLDAIPKQHIAEEESLENLADEGLPVKTKALKLPNMPMGISTIERRLPDNIKAGDFTALNTDQNLFFSFYSRINQQIRFHWFNGLEEAINSLAFRALAIKEERTFTTEIQVTTNAEGQFNDAKVFRSSGVASLDLAVVNAFKKATPFVNPPKEKVQDDGLIYLNYIFELRFSPSYFAQ